MDEARALVAELLALMPCLTVSRYEGTPLFVDPGFRQRCGEDLRALGVSE